MDTIMLGWASSRDDAVIFIHHHRDLFHQWKPEHVMEVVKEMGERHLAMFKDMNC